MIEKEMPVRKNIQQNIANTLIVMNKKILMKKKNGDQRRIKQNIILKLLKEVCTVKIAIMKDTLQKNVNY